MTLLEAPTGTFLFYYKDIKQEIVQTLLLEEYFVSKKWAIIMDRRQDLNVTSTIAGKNGPSTQDRYCARGFEILLLDLYLKRFDLTKGLLFKTFVASVLYKLCRCDHSILEFKSFLLIINL